MDDRQLVRNASEEAAKELAKNYKNGVFDYLRAEEIEVSATIIERHLAPVVAAAEGAMKEKCAKECDELAEEKFEEFTEQALAAKTCARFIRAIPTGTAMAEYVERATEELRKQNAYVIKANDGWRAQNHKDRTEYRIEIENAERATAELRAENTKLKTENDFARGAIGELVACDTETDDEAFARFLNWSGKFHEMKQEIANFGIRLIEVEQKAKLEEFECILANRPLDPVYWDKHRRAALSAPAKKGEKP